MEDPQARLKRMRMRSWRRGTKEMDLVLGPFADARLEQLSEDRLAVYDLLLAENDQDLMAWLMGLQPPPEWIVSILNEVNDFAQTRLKAMY